MNRVPVLDRAEQEAVLDALRWYADTANYLRVIQGNRLWSKPPVNIDGGAKANFVLAMIKDKGKA